MPKHSVASMFGVGGKAVEVVEVVAEGFAGWFISALADFTIGFIRNKIPIGKRRNVVRNRVHDLLRTDSKKVQDALKKMLSKHVELKTALSLINESLSLLEKPLQTGFLKITRLVRRSLSSPKNDAKTEIPPAARAKLEQALEICRRVQLETADTQAKLEAVKMRLFLTYILFAHDPEYSPSVMIKLLTNCINESLDPDDTETGLGGTLVILDRRRMLKQVLRITVEEKVIVKQVRELLLNTLSQISWYSRVMGHVYSPEDLEQIKSCFFEPQGFTAEEIERSWRPFILDWKSILEIDAGSQPASDLEFGPSIVDMVGDLFKIEKIVDFSDVKILGASSHRDRFYDHSYDIFVLVIATAQVKGRQTDVYAVIRLERIHAYPNALGVKWTYIRVCEDKPVSGYFDATDNSYCVAFRDGVDRIDLDSESYERQHPLTCEPICFRNCGASLFALTKLENEKLLYTKLQEEDWEKLAAFPANFPEEFGIRMQSEAPTLITVDSTGEISMNTHDEAASKDWDRQYNPSAFSKHHHGAFVIYDDALKFKPLADAGDGLQSDWLLVTASINDASAVVPVGTEILLVGESEVTFVDVFRIFAQ